MSLVGFHCWQFYQLSYKYVGRDIIMSCPDFIANKSGNVQKKGVKFESAH